MDLTFPLILGMLMCSLFSTLATLKFLKVERMRLLDSLFCTLGIPLMILAAIGLCTQLALLIMQGISHG